MIQSMTNPRAIGLVFAQGMKGQLKDWSGMAILCTVSLVLIGVWGSVWSLIGGELLFSVDLSWQKLVWYVTITEAVFFSVGHAWLDVEADVKNGRALAAHLRPANYLVLKIAGQAGKSLVLLIILFFVGSLFAFALTGFWMVSLERLPFIFLSMILGASLMILLQMMIGLLTQWIGEVRPVYMVIQKTTSVLGGLLVPLTLFPDWVQTVIWTTPFPAIFHGPAHLILNDQSGQIVATLAVQFFWFQIAIGALALLRLAFEESLLKEGGTL